MKKYYKEKRAYNGNGCWVPSEKDFKKAWRIYKRTGLWKKVAEGLDKSYSVFSKWKKRFERRFSDLEEEELLQKEKETYAGDGEKKVYRKLTAKMRKQILEYLSWDLTVEKAAQMVGINARSVYYWSKKYPAFKRQMDIARERNIDDIKNSLRRRARGGKAVKVSEKILYDKNGRIVGKERRIERIPVAGDTRAMEFFLINMANWKRDSESRTTDNKGKILEALERMTDISEEEMEEFE